MLYTPLKDALRIALDRGCWLYLLLCRFIGHVYEDISIGLCAQIAAAAGRKKMFYALYTSFLSFITLPFSIILSGVFHSFGRRRKH